MSDISALSAADTAPITIKDPRTGRPLRINPTTGQFGETGEPVTVTVYGPGSVQFRTARSEQENRNLERLRNTQAEPTPAENAAEIAEFLSGCTISFDNFNYKSMPNGREAFRALYLDPTLGFITDQVNRQMGTWSNFLPAASAN